MVERGELEAWLRLAELPGIGRVRARRLLSVFGTPQQLLAAPFSAWREFLDGEQAEALRHPSDAVEALIDRTWQWLNTADANPRHFVTLGDACYPRLLLETSDPPLVLYTVGRVDLLAAPGIAVVGSRNPT